MYGWRGRIGFINPTAVYDTPALEFQCILPEGFMVLACCLNIRNLLPEEFQKAWAAYREAALHLADCQADVIVAGGSPVMTLQGTDGDQRLIAELHGATGLPVTTLLTAEREAIQALGVKKVVLVSPFVEEINRQRVQYLAVHGIDVVAHRGVGISHNVEITRLSSEVPYRLAKELVAEHPQAQAAVMTCPRWPVVDILEAFEADTGKPAVTPVQAMIWKSLSLMGLRTPIRGYGRLLTELPQGL